MSKQEYDSCMNRIRKLSSKKQNELINMVFLEGIELQEFIVKRHDELSYKENITMSYDIKYNSSKQLNNFELAQYKYNGYGMDS